MSDFIVEHLTKSVGDKTVFRDISFIIHDFDRIGIIGVNGTGKQRSLMSFLVVLALMAMCRRLQLRTVIKLLI